MSILNLHSGALSLRVSTEGGLILGFWTGRGDERLALLRPALTDGADALASSCYPLVPFANRVRNNRFTFAGKPYRLTPNTAWDPHYLHGEGWLSRWSIERQAPDLVEMAFRQTGDTTPYRYRASQRFQLTEEGLELSLSVTNEGEDALPFGLGWHPYFPMTPGTELLAPARGFWTEVEGWLPGERAPIPADLDFSRFSPLPHRWVNNGFEDWSGQATIRWPEHGRQLRLDADPIFRHAFLFVSDKTFDPAFDRDYFCFEPMSHLADGHNLADLGGLKVLQPKDRLSGSIRLQVQEI